MEVDSKPGSLHLLLFTWLAFGHMHPFLELSKPLASRGHCITFISTPRNIQHLPRIPSHLSSLITFVPLELPRVEPLPENAESTTDIPQEHVQYLEKAFDGLAFDGLAAPFLAFLRSACSDKKTKPDWIIMDAHHHWLPTPSECAAASRTAVEHFTVPPNWIPFPSNLAFRPHEAWWIAMGSKENEFGISILHRVRSTIMGSDFVCIRACYELDSKWLSLLAKICNKDTVPVGLLPPPVEDTTPTGESKSGELEVDAIDWLNKHPPKSVLYIALGSEAALSTKLLHHVL